MHSKKLLKHGELICKFMAYTFIKTLNGTTVQFEDVPASNVAITEGALTANASGYADDATAATCITAIGVANNAVDNSGGSAGDLNVSVVVNPAAVFEIATSDTMAQAQVWKTVVSDAANLTITSNTAVTDETGIVKTRKYISASLAQGTIVFDGART